MTGLLHATGSLSLDTCRVMGVVNRTPDSFYDGGRMDLREAVDFGMRLVDEGADLLDVGGVKAGPGADVDETEELERVIPLIAELAVTTRVPVSIETSRPAVARRAFEAGASILNDVGGLADARLADACADAGGALVLMHHGGQIRGRPRNPRYRDVVTAILESWTASETIALRAGVRDEALVVDPGLDFGKTTWHSLELIRRLDELVAFGRPVLIAPSRKDVVGETLGLPPEERLEGTLAVAALAVWGGAAMIRAHDVAATARVVTMVEAVKGRAAPRAPARGVWE